MVVSVKISIIFFQMFYCTLLYKKQFQMTMDNLAQKFPQSLPSILENDYSENEI